MFKFIFGFLLFFALGLVFWTDLATAPIMHESVISPTDHLPLSSSTSDRLVITTEPQVATDTEPVIAEPAKPTSNLTPVAGTSTKSIILIADVPFISQAPRANWSDPLQENGCEEASVLMAVAWARQLSFDAASAEAEIVAMGKSQIKNYGVAVDTDVFDTVTRIFEGYWSFAGASASSDFTKANLISQLSAGRLILVPANGRLLKNPYFTPPGPTTHMLVIIGYDPNTDEFITHDPGTRRGAKFRYPATRLLSAAVNYPTGDHEVQDPSRKAFISVGR